MKKILILLLCLVMTLAIVSCGGSGDDGACTKHVDANGDGKCDSCDADVSTPDTPCTTHTDKNGDGKCDSCGADVEKETSISLFENGNANFQFVIGSGVSGNAGMKIQDFIYALEDNGIEVKKVNDLAATVTDCEILIGDVTTRGKEYEFDKYSLGKKGYVIKAIGNKIIINAGDSASLVSAIDIFLSQFMSYEYGTLGDVENVSFSTSDNVIEIQDDYKITSLTVGGKSIKGTTIAIDKKNATYYAVANKLQDTIYTHTGNYLKVVSLEEADSSSIILKHVADDGEWGFKVFIKDGALNIECGFTNRIDSAVSAFVNEEILAFTGNIDFSENYTHNKLVRVVTYEEFGAKGDGKTDDYFAINAAHNFANECGEIVVAKPGATYYIKNIVTDNGDGYADTVSIKTNVIWTDATFIIDDRGFLQTDKNNSSIFFVHSDYDYIHRETPESIEELIPGRKLDKDTSTSINWPYNFPAMIELYNENEKHFIRRGNYDEAGGAQHEIILVDENGNIDPSTPLNFDFEDITLVRIVRDDVKPITIKGGTFITYANDMPYLEGVDTSAYISRGFSVYRSNTTVDGLVHKVEFEEDREINGLPRHAYSGFLSVTRSNNVLLTNCTLQGRRYSKAAGTYDFQAGSSANLTLYNVNQSNFFDEQGKPTMDYYQFWGIGGTNYCKNLTYDTCTLSRFDAHEGLHNGKIINCTVSNIEIIGFGDMVIENTRFETVKLPPIMLRSDYGCTWRGTISLKNCTVDMTDKKDGGTNSLLSGGWANHDFGYICYFPNIVIDNLKWEGVDADYYFVTDFAPQQVITGATVGEDENLNPYQPPSFIKVINNEGGYTYVIPDNEFFYKTSLENVEFK